MGDILRSLEATQAQISKANVVVLDNRSPDELLAEPKVDGAYHVWGTGATIANVDKAIEDGVIPSEKSTPIVAYCAVGGRSGMCLQRLAELGYTDLVNGINLAQMVEALG